MTDNAPASDKPVASAQTPKRKRWGRRILITVIVVLLAVGLLVALLPTLLSSDFGRNRIVAIANDSLAGSVQIESISLGWFTGQTVRGVTVSDPDGNKVIELKEASTALSLLAALGGDLNLGETKVTGVRGDLVVDEAGVLNLQKVIGPVEPKEPPAEPQPIRIPPSLGIKAIVSDVRVTYSKPGAPPIALELESATVSMPKVDQPIEVELKCRPTHGELATDLSGKINVRPLFDADGTMLENAELNASVAFNITRSLVEQLLKTAEASTPVALAEDVTVQIEVPKLTSSTKGFDPKTVAVNLTVKTDRAIAISGDPTIGDVRIGELDVAVDSAKLSELIKLAMNADLTVGGRPGRIAVNGDVSEVFDVEGQAQPDRMRANINAELSNLPVALADRIAQQDGLILAALGERLDVSATAVGAADAQNVSITVDAPNLDASVAGRIADDAFTATQAGAVTFNLTRGLFEKLIAKFVKPTDPESKLALAADVPIRIEIPTLASTIKGFDPKTIAVGVSVKTDRDIEISGDPTIGDVRIGKLDVAVDSAKLSETIRLAMNADLTVGGRPGKIAVNGDVADVFDTENKPQPEKLRANINAELTNLPVALADKIAQQDGLVLAALGDRLDMSLTAKGSADAQDVSVAVDAPNLDVKLAGRIADDAFRSTDAGAVTFNLTRGLVEKLVKRSDPQSELALAADVPIRIEIPTLASSIKGFDPKTVAVAVKVSSGGEIAFSGDPTIGDVRIGEFTVNVDSANLNETIKLAINADMNAGGRPGKIAVNGDVADVFNAEGKTQIDKLKANVNAELSNLPVALADKIANQDGLLTEALGDRLDLTASVQSTGTDNARVTASVSAPKLPQVNATLAATNQVIRLEKPLTIDYTASTKLVKRFMPADSPYELKQDQRIVLTVSEFSAPMPKEDDPPFQPSKTKLVASLKPGVTHIAGLPTVGEAKLQNAAVDISGESLAAMKVNVVGQLADGAGKGAIAELAGADVLNLRADVATGLMDDNSLGPVDATFRFDNPRLAGQLAAKVAAGFASAVVADGSSLKLTVTPRLLEILEMTKPEQPTIAAPVTADLRLDGVSAPLKPFDMAAAKAKVHAAISAVSLAGKEELKGAGLGAMTADVTFDGSAGTAVVKVNGTAVAPGQSKPSPLTVDATVAKLVRDGKIDAAGATIDADVKLNDVPTAVIDTLSKQDGKLTPLLGPAVTVNANAKLSGGATRTGTVDAKLTSQHLSADAGLKLGETIDLSRPIKAKVTITPAAYAALTKPAPPAEGQKPVEGEPAKPIELTESFTLDATVDKLSAKLPAPAAEGEEAAPFDMREVALGANIAATPISLRDPASGKTVTIDKLTVQASAPKLADGLKANVDGLIREKGATGADQAGKLAVNATVTDLFNSEGELKADAASAEVNALLEQLPVALVDQLLQKEGMIVAALGPSLNIHFVTNLKNMQGPLALEVKAANARSNMKGRLGSDVFTLDEPLVAEFDVTRELGKKLLSKIHPIFESAESADRPIRLQIAHEGFVVPTKDFSITKVAIANGSLDIGKINLNRGGFLGLVMTGLDKVGIASGGSKEAFFAWFTPLQFNLKNGKFDYRNRMDLLVDNLAHLSTWGSVDLATEKLDMKLAIMGETLNRLPRVDDMASDDAYPIAIHGTTSKYEIGIAKAIIDLGRISGTAEGLSQVPAKDTPFGGLLGGVIKEVEKKVSGREEFIIKPPAASVQPLPWAGQPRTATPQATRQPEPTKQPTKTAPKPNSEPTVNDLFDLLRKPKK